MRLLMFVPALALLAPASALAETPVQTISLYSYGYKPAPIWLTAGHEVTLKFVNTSGKGHDFTAPEFFAHSKIVSGDVKEGEVDLKGDETKMVTLVPGAGEYKAHCGHLFHDSFGMHTTIVVR